MTVKRTRKREKLHRVLTYKNNRTVALVINHQSLQTEIFSSGRVDDF
jgi:hypothetical protein